MMHDLIKSQPSGAIFSPCHRYRYGLWRRWDCGQPMSLFIGLNPSTANAMTNDPTIRRCVGFARSWGYGGMVMTNLFAYRATQPRELRSVADPVGAETDRWIVRWCQTIVGSTLTDTAGGTEARVIAMWGNAGSWWGRDRAILTQIEPIVPHLHCLTVTQQGQPAHPLYLAKTLQPRLYSSTPIG